MTAVTPAVRAEPVRRGVLAAGAGLAGLAQIADGVLGHDAKHTAIAGVSAGVLFAFVSGFAGTFTACNIAVFGALPEVADARGTGRGRALAGASGWLVTGMLTVSMCYGAFAVLLGDRLPQLSSRVLSGGVPERLVQSSVVFGLIGLAFSYLGLASLGVLPDPMAARPRARMLILGALVGGLLVGRPYPLFFKLAAYAVATHNPLYGAVTFGLQSLGNVLFVVTLAVLLALVSGRSRAAQRGSAARIAGAVLVAFGVFLVVYWDVRLPAHFGYGWFPTMPWS